MAQKLAGSHLLAALHASMERIKTVLRICRAAGKPPQHRTSPDIDHLVAETQGVQLMTRQGAAVHRDLCHVVTVLSLNEMGTTRLLGAMLYVLHGRVQLRTKGSTAGFERLSAATAADANSNSHGSHGSECNGGGTTPGAAAAGTDAAASSTSSTEQELKALFESIDTDGSGAMDVEELQYALSVMGVIKSPEEVQELMDSVDKDGSGELDFDEFSLILRTRLGLGSSSGGGLAWTEQADGSSSCEVGPGAVLGELALLHGQSLEGQVIALEDCHLLLLEPAAYAAILADGFDGLLTAKTALLKTFCPVLAACLSSRSDMRGLAHDAVTQRFNWGEQLYAAGAADALFLIQEGSCRVIVRTLTQLQGSVGSRVAAMEQWAALAEPPAATASAAAEGQPGGAVCAAAAAAALMASPRQGLHTSRCRTVARKVEVAVLGPGDLAGEACLLGPAAGQPDSTAVVSSSQLVALKLPRQSVMQLVHPADLQRLCEYLQHREQQRHQRMLCAQHAADAASEAQQHLKAAAVAPDVAAWSRSSAASGHEPAGSRSAAAGGISAESAAAEAAVAGGWRLPVLPSSAAAAAAAAIAAAGGFSHRDLPSKLLQQKADAVSQLLHDLVLSREDMEAEHSSAGAAAVAAHAAAHTAAAAAGAAAAAAAAIASDRELYAAAGSNSSRKKPRRESQGTGGHCSSSTIAVNSRVTASSPAAMHAHAHSASQSLAARADGAVIDGPLGSPGEQRCSSCGCSHSSSGSARHACSTSGKGAPGSGGWLQPRKGSSQSNSASDQDLLQGCRSRSSPGGPRSSHTHRLQQLGRGSSSSSIRACSAAAAAGVAGCCLQRSPRLLISAPAGDSSAGVAQVMSHGDGITAQQEALPEHMQPAAAAVEPAAGCIAATAGLEEAKSTSRTRTIEQDGFFLLTASPEPWLVPASALSAVQQSLATNSIHLRTHRANSSQAAASSSSDGGGKVGSTTPGRVSKHGLAVVSIELQQTKRSSDTPSHHRNKDLAGTVKRLAAASATAAGSGAGGRAFLASSDPVLRASSCSPRAMKPQYAAAHSSSPGCGGRAAAGPCCPEIAVASTCAETVAGGRAAASSEGVMLLSARSTRGSSSKAATPRGCGLSHCGSAARPVAGGLFSRVDAGLMHAAGAAAESTSWSLGMQLLMAQQQAVDRCARGQGCNCSSSLRDDRARGIDGQQQEQPGKATPAAASVSAVIGAAATGSAPVPAGQLPERPPAARPPSVPKLQLYKLGFMPQQPAPSSSCQAADDATIRQHTSRRKYLQQVLLLAFAAARCSAWLAQCPDHSLGCGAAESASLAALDLPCRGSMSSRL